MQAPSDKPDSLGRRSRMRAHSTGKRIRLTDRDMIWLQALHRHGPLASSFLLEYIQPLGMNEKRARERLTDLFHESETEHGGAYLKRPRQQFHTIDARYNQLVYDLAPAGVQVLKDTGKWSEKSGPSGGPWWHSFMTSTITASVDLACADSKELSFIPQSKILERAQTTISTMIEYREPETGRVLSKKLCPDALFGLEYHTIEGSRFRFFAVEADRGSEPLRSSSSNRKSAVRNFAMYDAYIRGGIYKRHLKLTAPLLVLNVCENERRVQSQVQIAKWRYETLSYQLFCCFSVPNSHYQLSLGRRKFLDLQWCRPGLDDVRIGA